MTGPDGKNYRWVPLVGLPSSARGSRMQDGVPAWPLTIRTTRLYDKAICLWDTNDRNGSADGQK